MEKVKATKEYTIYKKASGRFCVTDEKKNWVNGEKKVEILTQAGLLKTPPKKKAAPAAEAAAPAAE